MEERNFDTHYIPGKKPIGYEPLDRYLPPIHDGIASYWLEKNIPEHGWLLDPFGASPKLLIEAARHGYRVIVSANNPITQFMLEILADPPPLSDFQSALALLASLQVGKERLEPHIKSLYETNCANCNEIVQAKEFLWRRDELIPYARIFECPSCKVSGEFPITTADEHKAEFFNRTGIHRARALERVAPLNDPDRRHVEEALSVYLPRAIYGLITIINKLNSIPITDPNHSLISALLLLAFDRANTLWLYPKERQRPRQLTIPGQFREHNIWLALETAANLWHPTGPPVAITHWPNIPPPEGGICIFDGRIKELASRLSGHNIQCILTAFPRPNQAFWTLSALWSGWLWGHEAVENFKSVLRRRRYDWGWHTHAISNALSSLSSEVPPKTPMLGLITEVEPGFLASVILGGQLANFNLCGIALRVEDDQAQVTWQSSQKSIREHPPSTDIVQTIRQFVQAYLQEQRGEPALYPYIHAAGLTGLTQNPPESPPLAPHEYLSKVQNDYHRALTYRYSFLRYGGSNKSDEIGLWWTLFVENNIMPLADRTEIALVNYLIKNPGCSLQEIDRAICQQMPGLSPPEYEMLQVCLQSYGFREYPNQDQWILNEKERPEKRREDIRNMVESIVQIGEHLGFMVKMDGEFPPIIQWIGTNQNLEYQFLVSASAILGKYFELKKNNNRKTIMILPGSRANLIAYKLKQNPYFSRQIQHEWEFIKYRHIRFLAESPTLQIQNLDEQFSLDPITYTQPQIRLL